MLARARWLGRLRGSRTYGAQATAQSVRASGVHGLFGDASKMLMSTMVTQVLGLGSAVLLRRFLGPSSMGSWTLLLTILGYAGLSHGGILYATEREYPRALAEGDVANALRILSAAGFAVYLGAGLTAGACACWALLSRQSGALMLIEAVFLAGAVMLQQTTALYTVMLRGRKQFGILSSNTMLVGMLTAFLLPAGAVLAGLPGVLAAALVVAVSGLLQLLRFGRMTRVSVRRADLTALLVAGLPMFVYILSFTVLRSLDRVAISAHLSLTALGDYSVAILLGTYLFMIPNTIAPVIYPRLQELVVDSGNLDPLRKLLRHGLPLLGFALAVLAGLALLAGPPVLGLLLPRFFMGLEPARILLIGTIPLALLNLPAQILLTARRQISLAVATCVITAVALPGELYAAATAGLDGVALATSLTYGILLITVVVLCGVAPNGRLAALGVALESLVPGGALAVWLVVATRGIAPVIGPNSESSLAAGGILAAVLLLPATLRLTLHVRGLQAVGWR
jgi:O-antigen/teichoic acid export membrane protein